MLMPKRFEVLHEAVPKSALIGFLVNPNNPNTDTETRDVRRAAEALGHTLSVMKAAAEDEFDPAFAGLVQQRAGAIVVAADAYFNNRSRQLVALAARYALPAIYSIREFTIAGGLMSYGANITEGYRQEGLYVGRILKGEKPADLPVQQSAKIELVSISRPPNAGSHVPNHAARPRRRSDRMSAPVQSWCDPAGESPAQVGSSVRLVASVAWPLATVVAKRTQRLHGVWD